MKRISGNREIYKAAVRLALPIGLQSLIALSVNLVDTVMVGRLGETSLSAVSLANQFITTYQASCLGIGMGASVMISRFYGGQDMDGVKKIVTVMLHLVVLFGLVFTIVTAAAPGFLMRIYTAETAIIREGKAYLRVSAFCYIIHGVTLTSTLVLRSVEKSRVPMFSSLIAFLINLAGNYAFIYGKFGLPLMGVTGAALSTLFARVFEFAFVAGYLFFGDKTVGYRFRDIFIKCLPEAREFFQIALPVFAGEALLAVGNNVLAMVMGRIGAAFVSANAIATVTQQLSTVLLQGVSQSACILVGQTLGRGEEQKAVRAARVMMRLGLYIGLAGSVLIMGSVGFVISVYRVTEETAVIAKQLFQVTALIVIFQSVDSVLTKGVLRGGGDTRFLLLIDTFFLWVLSVPLGAMAGLVWRFPAFLVYFFLKIDRIFSCALCLWRLKSGKWIHSIRQE